MTTLVKRRRLNEINLPQSALDQLFVECLGSKAGAVRETMWRRLDELTGQDPSAAHLIQAASYRRQDGAPWTDDDVGELTRVPTYAGYVLSRGKVRHAPDITPIVDLATFVLRRAKSTAWRSVSEGELESREGAA